MVIVIAVIAILAAVLIPTFSNVVEKAQDSAFKQEAANAYKVALADALANDGVITDGEQGFDVEGENWTWTYYSKDGKESTFDSETNTWSEKIAHTHTENNPADGKCATCGKDYTPA